jgi:hypothetical protein
VYFILLVIVVNLAVMYLDYTANDVKRKKVLKITKTLKVFPRY